MPVHLGLPEGSAVDAEAIIMTAAGRMGVRLADVALGDCAGRYQIVKVDRQGRMAP